MKVKLSLISLSAYVIPALLAIIVAPNYGYLFSEGGINVISTSVIAGIFGYLASFLFSRRNQTLSGQSQNATETYLSLTMMLIGATAIILNFAIQGKIPLLASGSGRIELQATPLWNVFIVGMLGVFMYSRATIGHRQGNLGRVALAIYMIAAILSAWKGTFILALISYLAPRVRNSSFRVSTLLVGSAVIFSLLILVNLVRSEATLLDVLSQPIYYVIWGFVNFDAEAVRSVTSCLHTLPVIGCQFGVENHYLISPTWNVFTALSPIFLDGGTTYVGIFFFSAGLALGVFERRRGTLMNDYLYFLANYFFLMAHNGYAFYSSSFVFAVAVIFSVTLLRLMSQPRARIRDRPAISPL